jgi:hypothetical protein
MTRLWCSEILSLRLRSGQVPSTAPSQALPASVGMTERFGERTSAAEAASPLYADVARVKLVPFPNPALRGELPETVGRGREYRDPSTARSDSLCEWECSAQDDNVVGGFVRIKIPAPWAPLRASSVSPKNGETRTRHPSFSRIFSARAYLSG